LTSFGTSKLVPFPNPYYKANPFYFLDHRQSLAPKNSQSVVARRAEQTTLVCYCKRPSFTASFAGDEKLKSGSMLIHPDRLFPAEPGTRQIARTLYEHVRHLPLVSPHGHTQASWFAENKPFPGPVQLFVQPDHYVFRMLYSQGISLEELEIGLP
jgi:hypothetical protein